MAAGSVTGAETTVPGAGTPVAGPGAPAADAETAAEADVGTLPPVGPDLAPGLARAHPSVRAEVEDFLYDEAHLLDTWRLDEWLALFAADGRYSVPSTDLPDGDDDLDLALVNDDVGRLEGRVWRLKSAWAHIENPHSRLRRVVTNVRVWEDGAGELHVESAVVVHRCRSTGTTTYVAGVTHLLRREGATFRIARRRAVLDHLTLRDCGGVLSIIV